MKFNTEIVLNVVIGLLIFKVLDKLFLDSALSSILPNSYEDYEDLDEE